ncbi:MAG: 1-acyl-sn-glycerol-3-phosphate acyltransferase [Thermodesulfobacteriota bacterium]|nr:1-acyl-sn-glycerol-3-phosphate acyltransferase [Thermodesulfobacteriota bacterium]
MLKWTKLQLEKFKTKFKKKKVDFSENKHNHYFFQLPDNIGMLSTFILKLFFSGIKVTKEQTHNLNKLQKEGIVIYVTKPKSYFLYLFYYTRYKQDGLPFPQIGFDYNIIIWQPVSRFLKTFFSYLDYIFHNLALPDPYGSGYIRNSLTNGQSALLSLVEQKGFHRRFIKAKKDPVQYLIEMQKSIERPIFLVPQLMFFDKKPDRSMPNIMDILFGTKENPGKIRRLMMLFKNPGRVFVEISEPVNLKNFLALAENREKSIEYQTLALRRNLLNQINRHRQSITGPVLKTRHEMKENILTKERLQTFMEHHSKARNIPIQKVRKKASDSLDEIAANYSMIIIKLYSVLITWVLNTMFEGVTVDKNGLNRVKSMSQKGPVILIPCHKSHIDYLILSYLLYHNNMPCPHVAAGKNLSFWPIGSLFRSGGAFFIRRTFRGAVLYSKVFAEYIHNLLAEGFNIEFFIEGGRSRTGKLILPKLGLLSILLNSYKNKACEDMIFAPIFIGYDTVLEESSYLHEIEGKEKQPESLLQVIKARKFLKKRYGRIYIQFHEPISLKELLLQYGTPIQDMGSKEFNIFCRNLGHRVINAINLVTVVTPHALVAAALMNCSKKSFSFDHLISHVETYMNLLLSQKARLADTLLLDHVHTVEHVLDTYVQRKFIERITKDKKASLADTLLRVNESKRPNLEYYKNNCIAFFVPAAITSLAILVKDAFLFSASDLHADYEFLQYFFKYEFAYDVDKTTESFVRKNIKAFIDETILMPHPTLPDTYNLTSSGFRKLRLFSSFLKTYFESYWIVLNFFIQHPSNSIKTKDRIKKIETIGNRMYKKKEIERKEALSIVNYNNGIDFFTTNGVKDSDNKDRIEFYANAIQKYLNCL